MHTQYDKHLILNNKFLQVDCPCIVLPRGQSKYMDDHKMLHSTAHLVFRYT